VGAADRPGERPPSSFTDLGVRTASGVALGLVMLAALWFGGLWFAALIALAAGAMGWELRAMLRPGATDLVGLAGIAAAAGACLATQLWLMRYGVGWAALGVAVIVALALARGEKPWFFAAAILYISLSMAGLIGLRADPLYGFAAALWVVLVVIATDVGAYFGGRIIGGPRLWPSVSPKKTWAGLGAGVLTAATVGAIFSAATTGTLLHEVAVVSAVMAVVAQGGDLAESHVKRRLDVKDSSGLIPGHGGVLDRLDGLMAASLVASLVTFGRGQSVFIW
jgi:phosphatidate cytidylyltransferase